MDLLIIAINKKSQKDKYYSYYEFDQYYFNHTLIKLIIKIVNTIKVYIF